MSVPLPPPVEFDSPEEIHFSWWLEELVSAGYVLRWERGQTYELVPAIVQPYCQVRVSEKSMKALPDKMANTTLKTRLKYTPDFEIWWNLKAFGLFYVNHRGLPTIGPIEHHFIGHLDPEGMAFSLIEVKPRVAGRSTMNTGRLSISRMNCMMLYEKQGIFTNLVEVGTQPGSIFAKTFTPGRFLKTDKSGKPRTLKFQPRDLSGFVAGTPKLKIRTHSQNAHS